jgi:hypothetical protein
MRSPITGEAERLWESEQPNFGAANALGRLIEPLGLTLDDAGGSVKSGWLILREFYLSREPVIAVRKIGESQPEPFSREPAAWGIKVLSLTRAVAGPVVEGWSFSCSPKLRLAGQQAPGRHLESPQQLRTQPLRSGHGDTRTRGEQTPPKCFEPSCRRHSFAPVKTMSTFVVPTSRQCPRRVQNLVTGLHPGSVDTRPS